MEIVTELEVESVLKSMQRNKTLGRDGFSVEVYVMFWPVFKKHLTVIVQYCVSTWELSSTMKKGAITLIFKKGDRREIKNWRPITLLNVDYKLVAKLLASRMSLVVNKLVGEGQVCAVLGRRISEI